MPNDKIEILIARLGLAFPFLYAAVSSLLHPDAWIGFFPGFIINILPASVLLISWATIEIVIGVWLVIGKKIFIPSMFAALMLASIIMFNFRLLDIIFRDFSILATAVVLIIFSYKNR